jgi:hypothetical protein
MDGVERRLRDFITTVQELERNRFYEALWVSLHIDEESFSLPDLDLDGLKSFLVTFRRFTLQNDPCSIDSIHADALKQFRGRKAERWIRLSMRRVQHAKNKGALLYVGQGTDTIRPIDLFMWWTSGDPAMFHADDRKRQRWEQLALNSSLQSAAQAVILQFIRKMVRELQHLKGVISRELSN